MVKKQEKERKQTFRERNKTITQPHHKDLWIKKEEIQLNHITRLVIKKERRKTAFHQKKKKKKKKKKVSGGSPSFPFSKYFSKQQKSGIQEEEARRERRLGREGGERGEREGKRKGKRKGKKEGRGRGNYVTN